MSQFYSYANLCSKGVSLLSRLGPPQPEAEQPAIVDEPLSLAVSAAPEPVTFTATLGPLPSETGL